MRTPIDHRTCDVCFAEMKERAAKDWLVVSVPTQVNDLDICPHCAQIIQCALQMGWLSAIVEALVALQNEQSRQD
jgi:hypothetical protein